MIRAIFEPVGPPIPTPKSTSRLIRTAFARAKTKNRIAFIIRLHLDTWRNTMIRLRTHGKNLPHRVEPERDLTIRLVLKQAYTLAKNRLSYAT